MDYSEIHQAIKAKGFTWAMAAEAIGCTPNYLMTVCNGRRKSRRVALAVAFLLNKKVSDVFPDVPEYLENPKHDRAERVARVRKKLEKAGLAA